MSVLLDTSVLFAFLYGADDDHDAALAFMQGVWAGRHGTPVVSTWVVDELLTLVRVRAGRSTLERGVRELLFGPDAALSRVRLIPVGVERLEAVWAAYERHRDRRLSATDASHLVLMEEHGIDALGTFERGFDGLVPVLPGGRSTKD